MLNPMISKMDKITRIPPNPPTPNPRLSRMFGNGIAADTNKDRKVFIEKIDWMNRGARKNSKPAMYFDPVFTKILMYTAMRPMSRNMLIHTTVTPNAGRKISEEVSGSTRK
jgi:hypothetical protein